jgi:hypothetical protein
MSATGQSRCFERYCGTPALLRSQTSPAVAAFDAEGQWQTLNLNNATPRRCVGSPGLRNKARYAGFHHSVEPDARRDPPNLPHGVFRYGRKLEVLLDAAGRD